MICQQYLDHIEPLAGTLSRLVESQEQVATLGYVDTLEEQSLLEEMLEAVKPPYPSDSEGYHYLLKTPFRYPPLEWGSRFGRVHEPSIFYAGLSVSSTLAEAAYYRFVFWQSMDAPAIKSSIRSEHTLFSVGYNTGYGLRLNAPAFHEFSSELTHPSNYQPCQLLGTRLRDLVSMFEYQSARDPEQGACVGVFTPEVFTRKKPTESSQWLCETNASEVLYKQVGSKGVINFRIEDFSIDGELPYPA